MNGGTAEGCSGVKGKKRREEREMK